MSRPTFPKHGTVKGSMERVEKEEAFLCERLLREISLKRNAHSHTKWISCNNPIPSVVQGNKRPVCGLVALCMAGHMLQKHDSIVRIYENDEKILEIAKNLGFSKQGEMFSVDELSDLAERVLHCKSYINERPLTSSRKDILHHIALGYPVLTPYDSDRNNEPCLKGGHKAHWAILTGFIIGVHSPPTTIDGNTSVVKLSNQDAVGFIKRLNTKDIELPRLYVYAKQGKSAKQQLWSLQDLSDSNGNLIEVSPDRDHQQYHIPPAGLKAALCSKSVLLYPNNQQLPQ